MMSKLWQQKPRLTYPKNIIDIVQFGSSVMEGSSPNDIDIAVVYHDGGVKMQLIVSQKIKRQLEKHSSIPIHMKSFDFNSLFEPANFAKDGILFFGKSIVTGKYFSENLGLKPRIQISYSLEKLDKKTKIKFHYMLRGKNGKYGLLKAYGGELIRPGLIEVMPEHEAIFSKAISGMTKEYTKRKILF